MEEAEEKVVVGWVGEAEEKVVVGWVEVGGKEEVGWVERVVLG